MNAACDVCGLRFEREPGYFLGAMYVSYGMGVFTILPISMLLILVAGWSLVPVLALLFVQTFVSMPLFYRYSRIIWIHVDQAFIPTDAEQQKRRR
jgi:hypothetical protein